MAETKAEVVKKLMDRLKISKADAEELYDFDRKINKTIKNEKGEVKKMTNKKKGAITQEELDQMNELIRNEFPNTEFQNKDLDNVRDILGLSNRQTPSRLSKMVEQGMLTVVGDSKPKKYNIV